MDVGSTAQSRLVVVAGGGCSASGPAGAAVVATDKPAGAAVVAPDNPAGAAVVAPNGPGRDGFLKQWSTRPSISEGCSQLKDSASRKVQKNWAGIVSNCVHVNPAHPSCELQASSQAVTSKTSESTAAFPPLNVIEFPSGVLTL
jgi:hypothetical protein